jgi:predicted metal-binding membrane protein
MIGTTAHGERPPTLLESGLRAAHAPVVVLLTFLLLVSWLWIVVMARDMYGPMSGASAWMMTPVWDARHLTLLWAMWAVMMLGMMLPSAAPMLLTYGTIVRRSATTPGAAARQTYALAAGYLVVWALFSVGATGLQRFLAGRFLVSPMMEASPAVGGVLLLVAGVYQLTPIKLTCLRTCRSPFGFLMSRWRPGLAGAFRMGLEHGVFCVGCCWALMLLLFVGGVMNLFVIAALTAFVAFEKLTPFEVLPARISGVLLIGAAFWILVF